MNLPSWERKRNTNEETIEEMARQLMYKRKITYQEAEELIKKGQRSISEF